MKKFLLGTVMLLAAGTSFAQDILTLSPETLTLKAGQIEEVTVGISAAEYDYYSGMEMVIEMPEGLEVVPDTTYDKRGNPVYTWIKPLAHLKDANFSLSYKWVPVGDPANSSGKNEFRVIPVSMTGEVFPYDYVEDLFSFRVKATDKLHTGAVPMKIRNILANHPIPGGQQGVEFPDCDAEYQYAIDFVIGESGYATLSWPLALDFTSNGFEANIVTDVKNSTMILEKVAKAKAGTGLVIVGEPGTYSLTTTTEDVAEAANILESTATAPYKVENSAVYALGNKAAGIGFYKVNDGVEIPQYRAYYTAQSGADAFFFDNADAISNVEVEANEAEVYTISGVKVQNSNQKGVYIVNGKKVVVK